MTAAMMKAAYLERRGSANDLVYSDVPQPMPDTDEVLVNIHAATVMPTELTWGFTWETKAGRARPFPIILGHEFSGVVAAVGAGVAGLAVGDAVYGMNDWDRQGAQAGYCLTRPQQIAPKPRTLNHSQAAATPISALTAWQALVQHGQLAAGQCVLIHGAAGGVGTFAVQIARSRGAQVITTASTHNADFARTLGADEVLDYATTRFDEAVHDVDLVLDTQGGETQDRSWRVLKPGGLLVSLVHPPSEEQAAAQGARGLFFIVEPDHEQLAELARLIDSGQLQTFVAAEYPLAQAREAFAFAVSGHRQGKTVLRVAE